MKINFNKNMKITKIIIKINKYIKNQNMVKIFKIKNMKI